ncbi:MAG: TnpV protein [Lachnospira sp.]|nr:TnpV protein [Lachnospira sp.]
MEQLKATDQLKWVGLMNDLKNVAEEIILEKNVFN